METIDLHIHSDFSDGTYDYIQIIMFLLSKGIRKASITDHDSLKNVPVFMPIFDYYGISIIEGVELNTDIKNMHILGYGMKDIEKVNSVIKKYKEENVEVCKKVIKLLSDNGYAISYDDVVRHIAESEKKRKTKIRERIESLTSFKQTLTCNCIDLERFSTTDDLKMIIDKRDITRYLIELGAAQTVYDVYRKLIGANAPYYIPINKISRYEAIELLISCGGVPVLAHPSSLRLDDETLRKEIYDLVDHGLQGIETQGTEILDEKRLLYESIADDCSILITGGSDFHESESLGIVCDESIWNNLNKQICKNHSKC